MRTLKTPSSSKYLFYFRCLLPAFELQGAPAWGEEKGSVAIVWWAELYVTHVLFLPYYLPTLILFRNIGRGIEKFSDT